MLKPSKILKGYFFSYPMPSHNSPVKPLILDLVKRDVSLTFFNTTKFENYYNHKNISFAEYENYVGFESVLMNSESTIYDIGLGILKTTSALMEHLAQVIEKNKPDFLIHLKFCHWAKLLAVKYNIPAINLTTGFIYNPNYLSNHNRQNKVTPAKSNNLLQGKAYHKELIKMYAKLGVKNIDSYDAYVNKEGLNLIFTLKEFQPKADSLDDTHKYIGMYNLPMFPECKRNTIYVSLGTIFNTDVEFVKSCISILKDFNFEVVVSVGNNIDKFKQNDLPSNVLVSRSVDQLQILNQSVLFITHGGGNSIIESIFYEVPMLIIPGMIEHELYADRITERGFGEELHKADLTTEALRNSITMILSKNADYVNNIKKFKQSIEYVQNKVDAVQIIEDYLN